MVAEGVHRPSAGRAVTARIVVRDDGDSQMPFEEEYIVGRLEANCREGRRGVEHSFATAVPETEGFQSNDIMARSTV